METNVQIILIVAVVIVILVTLFLNRGRLKRLGIKAGREGFEVEAQMTDENQNEIEKGHQQKRRLLLNKSTKKATSIRSKWVATMFRHER